MISKSRSLANYVGRIMVIIVFNCETYIILSRSSTQNRLSHTSSENHSYSFSRNARRLRNAKHYSNQRCVHENRPKYTILLFPTVLLPENILRY